MDDVASKLADIRRRIEAACSRVGRAPDSVRLIAVSKTFDAGLLLQATACGQRDFGESYLQEALPKMIAVNAGAAPQPYWHFIGPIQSNKTAAIAEHFDWAHGVERLKIAERLSAQRCDDQPPLNICAQVNVSLEPSKAGCAPADAAALCAAIAKLPRLQLRGLMAIPAAVDVAEDARPAFRALRELHAAIRGGGGVDAAAFDTLSMGMSDDFEVAIEEGARLIRVGSALFGERS